MLPFIQSSQVGGVKLAFGGDITEEEEVEEEEAYAGLIFFRWLLKL